MRILTIRSFLVLTMISICVSCKKYLDVKSDQALSTVSSLKDLQAILDNRDLYLNSTILNVSMSDEYYYPAETWESTAASVDYLAHIWDAEINNFQDWAVSYRKAFVVNNVLDNWAKVAGSNPSQEALDIKGSALFLRSLYFFQLMQLFAPQYDPVTAATDLGIVLRSNGDFNEKSVRSTVEECYDYILDDLVEATSVLSPQMQYKTRPGKAAALGLLARVYLQVGDYGKASEAANESLKLYNKLIDYNDPSQVDTLTAESFLKINKDNDEIIYLHNNDGSYNLFLTDAKIDSTLIAAYHVNDLRKPAFFRQNPDGSYYFRGSYNGTFTMGAFVGIGTAEIYLIKAEALARLGEKDAALQELNTLLKTRYKTGTFNDLTASGAEEALDLVLMERRKEMVYRGMRWADLRRLNKESARAVVLKRVLNGETFLLEPNDLRYTLLIPREIIALTDLEQNPR